MSLSKTFLLLRAFVMVCMAGFVGSSALQAVSTMRARDADARAAGLRADLTAFTAALARERGATLLLYAEGPEREAGRALVTALRLETDRRRAAVAEAVTGLREALGAGPETAAWGRATEAHEAVLALRRALDASGPGEPPRVAAAQWREAATRDVAAHVALWRVSLMERRGARDAEVRGAEAEVTAAATAEALGRTRALGADLLGSRRLASDAEARELAAAEATAREGLATLAAEAATLGDKGLAAAVREAQAALEAAVAPHTARLRAREAAELSPRHWFELATQAVDAALAVGALLQHRSQEAHAEAQAAARRHVVALGVFLAVLVTGLAIAARVVQRRVLRPIAALRAAATRLGAGDLSTPVEALGPDEVGELAAAMDAMRRRLRDGEAHLRELVDRLTTARAELVAAEGMVAVAQLAAGVAHEVNNPLVAVVANCQCALEDLRALPEEVARALPGGGRDLCAALEDAAQGGERIRAIIDRLRAFTAAPPPSLAAVDPVAEARLALAVATPAVSGGARVVDGMEAVPAVRAEAGMLRHVFLALLKNALDAAGDAGEVRLTSGSTAAESWIAVEDTGPGIPADHLSRIFEPFFGTKGVGKGAGLGLSVAHGLVAASGGRIAVDSPPGRGAKLTVWLQRPPAAPA